MLIIGFGNPRRRDEAIGYQAAELLGGIACYHLTPDLARTVASTDKVVFLDGAPGTLEVREIEPEDGRGDAPYHLTPPQLLGLAQRLYGRCPKAWVVRGGAVEFGFGDALSNPGIRNLHDMMAECDRLSRDAVKTGA